MIYSYKRDGVVFELANPKQLEEPRRNLFSADTFTLVVGRNGAGKTRFLSGLANEIVKKKGAGIVRSQQGSGNEFIILYTSSPFPGIRPRSSSRIRRLGPTTPKAIVSQDLLRSISAAFSASGAAELKLRSDYKSGLRSIVACLFEIPLRLRGELINSISSELDFYHSISVKWVKLSSSGEVQSASVAKLEMESIQKRIHELVESHLNRSFPAAQYKLNLHSLDLAIKRNKKKRRDLVQSFLDFAGNRDSIDVNLQSAMDDIEMALAEYGGELLSGSVVKVREDAVAVPNYEKDSALVFAMAGASSGESALFDQFAKIDREVQAVSGQDKDLMILIDEGDAFLHFNWQQKYIKFLDAFVERVRCGFESVQIVLTTHSPILMSDVPSGNVIRLGDFDGPLSTFGAPLERIIGSTVGAGSIGDFAADKISEMIERKRYVDPYIVDQIDDRFIRAELRRFLWE
ncbi:hypothetical protein ROV94_07535 [Stenotrophomonas maltophilia]|uniref:AAA family ATPase n=1 Tax=Stenotrophomonas maltophilia TaxID=40324 RepID=UPI001313C6BC|nr:AAA family ATPase [Stenotrophomonas maltophilia]MDT3430719.1 hypothetical protein [Stenotrophomonas maltophilia]